MLDIGTEVAFAAQLDQWGLPLTCLLPPDSLKNPFIRRGRVVYFIPGEQQIAVMDRRRHVWKMKVRNVSGY